MAIVEEILEFFAVEVLVLTGAFAEEKPITAGTILGDVLLNESTIRGDASAWTNHNHVCSMISGHIEMGFRKENGEGFVKEVGTLREMSSSNTDSVAIVGLIANNGDCEVDFIGEK